MTYQIVWLHPEVHQRAGNVANENYGNLLQRVLKPLSLWQFDTEIQMDAVSLDDIDAVDRVCAADLLIVVQCTASWLWQAIQQRRSAGLCSIFELNDDIAAAAPWLPAQHPLKSPLFRQQLLNLAAICDAVQFSSEQLAERYAALHPTTQVIHPWVSAPAEKPEKPAGFRIGWGGTTTHLDDLCWIAPAIAEFLLQHPDASFSVMGNHTALAPFLDLLPAAQLIIVPFCAEPAYFRFLQQLHVGIAPLQHSQFNQCRSDGKFVQYAINGCAAVLSEHPVFQHVADQALLFRDPAELHAQLTTLYQDRTQLERLATLGYQWAVKHRTPAVIKQSLTEWLRQFLPAAPQDRRHQESVSAVMRQSWTQIMLLQHQGRHLDIVPLCKQILTQHPGYHAVRWQLAQRMRQTGEITAFLQLCQQAPEHAIWRQEFSLMGYNLARQHAVSLVTLFFQRLPIARQLLLQPLPVHDLPGYFRQVLQLFPYQYFALFGLIQLLRQDSNPQPPLQAELRLLQARAQLLQPVVPQDAP